MSVEVLLSRHAHAEAVHALERRVAEIRSAINAGRSKLQARISELQGRFRLLAENRLTLPEQSDRLRTYIRNAPPPDWPAEEKARLEAGVAGILAKVTVPNRVQTALNVPAIRNLEVAERVIEQSQLALAKGRQGLEREINQTHARLLKDRFGGHAAASQTLVDFLTEHREPMSPSAAEDKIERKLDRLMANIAALQDTAGWAQWTEKAAEIRREGDPDRRRMLYENLVLGCDKALRHLRQLREFQEELDGLIDSAAYLKGTAVDQVVAELQALKRAGLVVSLEALRARLKDTMEREQKKMDQQRKRNAIVESLQKLGYQVTEGMTVGSIRGGRLVVQKADDEYAVEVVMDSDSTLLQTVMIRYAASAEITDQQRLRDKEREEAWCSDHARLLEQLAERGLATNFKLKVPSGQHPVKVVVVEDKQVQRRAAAARTTPQRREL